MAIKFQYNKTSLQDLNKQLKVRVRALPTIKNKESALRSEVKKAKTDADSFDRKLEQQIKEYEYMQRLWGEFDTNLIAIKDVELSMKKIAGVKTPILERIVLDVKPYSLFNSPGWIQKGITILETIATTAIEREFFNRKMMLLDYARKKTTQKVNLYEKIQIPGYEEAILKIKRFLEDEENLSKSSQKIVKTRQQVEEEMA
ncbi:MAG: V-type ATP synthase subunit D [Salinivirgaceae bacterium]|nr:V-type ATP synthase subunit D [Salinivirgaceae bacterium]MDD4746712.1 V-type ATP synthase subunit D [Salinivirgaceae bacterium]MDY0280307.1 V-type ATP synthase subunit D [Salinivirgaceae bacterium]